MKNFMKLLGENKAILISIVAPVFLVFGMVYAPVVRSVLSVLGLITFIALLGYAVYAGIQSIRDCELLRSRRNYKESQKDYYFYKIYMSDLLTVILNLALVASMIALTLISVYLFFISLKQPELFEGAKLLFASTGLLVGTLFLAIFLKERKNL